MPRLEEVANVVLRVPSIVLLDLLYRWDVQAFAELLRPKQEEAAWRRRALWHAYYLGHVLCVVVLLLPVRSLVRLYLYGLTLLLLFVGHQTARDYMRHEMEDEFQGAVYQDPVVLRRFVTALTGQIFVSVLCALLMKTKQVWLFCAPLLPLLARLCGLPLQALPVVNTFAASVTVVEVLYVAASHLLVPFHLAAVACREVAQGLEMYRLVALGMSLWSQLAVPVLFLVFWLVLFTLQIYSFLASSNSLLAQQGLLFIFLSSVAECCGTPYSLLGLTFTVSYLALAVLNLCKFYLLGYDAFQNGNVMHRGVTEGVTLLLLALQTGLLDLQILQRTFLLSIILFIVVTSTLQSMIEIADPIVLALGASQNRSPWKHFRSLSLCLFLLVFPCFMAYKIARFFHMDFWLLILVSSCMLTSLQVMGTLFVYALFMIELLQDAPLEKTDEIIYYVNAVSRVLEFLVAVCVVAYGTWESIFGEWSWMGASVIIIHSYFNVWLRAQSGWKSFLLRREAAKKINSLPRATRGQLRDHNDVCAICFQEMNVAVITDCGHFFHTGCLRKWLYVQDTCPMCHQPVKPSATEGPQPIGGEQAEPEPVPEEGPPEDAAAEAAGRARTPGPSRAAEGGEPSWQQQENPALAEPSRAAEGGEPSWQEQENPALAAPSRAAEGGEPSWQEQENPALAEPSRAAEGGEPSWQQQENPALAEPSRAAEGGEPSWQQQENPALAEPSRAAEGGEPSWQQQENPALAEPSRAAEGGEPSWQQQENPALAEPSRAAEGGEPSWQQQENPALAAPSRAAEGGEPSWQEQENPALAEPSRAAEGGEPSWQEQENPALAEPSRAAEGGEPSWQEQENPALAVPSRAGLLPEAVRSREDEPMDPAGSRTPPPVSRGCTP